MSRFAFVDTGAWFAAVVPWDANHAAAAAWFEHNERPLISTDYIVDETLTLLRSRGEGQRAITLGERFFGGQLAAVHLLSSDQIEAAWEVFRRFRDKEWSFTDCTSKVVIEELACPVAVAFDEHFRQFGSVLVEP
jgi:hypothetical protein